MTCSPSVPAVPILAEPVGCCGPLNNWFAAGGTPFLINADTTTLVMLTVPPALGFDYPVTGMGLGSRQWLAPTRGKFSDPANSHTLLVKNDGTMTDLGASPVPVGGTVNTALLRFVAGSPFVLPDLYRMTYSTVGDAVTPFSWSLLSYPANRYCFAKAMTGTTCYVVFSDDPGLASTTYYIGAYTAGLSLTILGSVPIDLAAGFNAIGAGFGNTDTAMFLVNGNNTEPDGPAFPGLIVVDAGSVITADMSRANSLCTAISAYLGGSTWNLTLGSQQGLTCIGTQWIATLTVTLGATTYRLWCRSTDKGATWTISTLSGAAFFQYLWAARTSTTVLWGDNNRAASPGAAMTATSWAAFNPFIIVPNDLNIGQRP